MARRNVDETTQVYATDEVVIFIAYNGFRINARFYGVLYAVIFRFLNF